MQLSQPMDRKRRMVIFIALGVVAVLIVLVALGVFRSGRQVGAVQLRCVSTQDVTPFGENLLYYDGMTLFCLNARGHEKWSYTLGENASFSCSDTLLAFFCSSCTCRDATLFVTLVPEVLRIDAA